MSIGLKQILNVLAGAEFKNGVKKRIRLKSPSMNEDDYLHCLAG